MTTRLRMAPSFRNSENTAETRSTSYNRHVSTERGKADEGTSRGNPGKNSPYVDG